MARLFEAEVEFLSDQQEVIVVYTDFFSLLMHGLQERCFYLLVFGVLSWRVGTLLSEIQTYRRVINIIIVIGSKSRLLCVLHEGRWVW